MNARSEIENIDEILNFYFPKKDACKNYAKSKFQSVKSIRVTGNQDYNETDILSFVLDCAFIALLETDVKGHRK